MGELCAPPTAVGGAALHKHRSPDDNNGQTIDRWSLQEEEEKEEEEEEEEEPLEKRKLIYMYIERPYKTVMYFHTYMYCNTQLYEYTML